MSAPILRRHGDARHDHDARRTPDRRTRPARATRAARRARTAPARTGSRRRASSRERTGAGRDAGTERARASPTRCRRERAQLLDHRPHGELAGARARRRAGRRRRRGTGRRRTRPRSSRSRRKPSRLRSRALRHAIDRPPICSTSCATATLDTVARPMWLSGIRNADATLLEHADLVADVHEVGPGRRLDLADDLEVGAGHDGSCNSAACRLLPSYAVARWTSSWCRPRSPITTSTTTTSRSGSATGSASSSLIRTREIVERISPPARSAILDVGGGTGVHARWLARGGPRRGAGRSDAPPRRGRGRARSRKDCAVTAQIGDARALTQADGALRRRAPPRAALPPHRTRRSTPSVARSPARR